jgi:hypothetical protein
MYGSAIPFKGSKRAFFFENNEIGSPFSPRISYN